MTGALRANREYQAVLSGQAVSALGDAISITAMPLLVLALTGSGALLGIVGALQLLPDLLFGLVAGVLADRWDRRRMMLLSDIGRAVLTALIPLSYWLGWPTVVVVLIVAVPINTLRLLSDAGLSSVMPGLVGRENLGKANSYMEATLSVPFVVGPALAGVLVASIGAPATLAIDAASFAISAACLSLVRRSFRADRVGELPRLLHDIREGIEFVWRRFVLRTMIAYWGAFAVATAAIVPTLSFYVTIDRDHGPELFGAIGSTWSIGYLAGSLAAGRISRGRVGVRMLVTGALVGMALIAIAATDSPAVFLGAAALIGAALAVLLVSYVTLRASLTPDELLGRVGSTARTISAGLQPLGLLGAGALIAASNGGVTLATMGVTVLTLTAVFWLSRSFREAELPADA